MEKTRHPFRSRQTWLTDDDLILLDAMFDGWASFGLLRGHTFQSQWNVPYRHPFSDEDLLTRLNLLVSHRVLNTSESSSGQRFGFSSLGGDLWSKERQPNWRRYCTASRADTRVDRSRLTVVAVSKQTRDDYLLHCSPSEARTRKRILKNHEVVYWKPAADVHVGVAYYDSRCGLGSASYGQPDRDQVVDSARSWWTTVAELQHFVMKD